MKGSRSASSRLGDASFNLRNFFRQLTGTDLVEAMSSQNLIWLLTNSRKQIREMRSLACRANRFAKCGCLRVPARARPRSSPARPDPTRRSRSEFVNAGEDSAEDLQGGPSKRLQPIPREKSPESARKRQKAPESARKRQDSHAHTSSLGRAQLGPN